MKPVALTNARQNLLKLADADKAVFAEIQSGITRLYQLSTAPLLAAIRPEGREMVVVAVVGKNLKIGALELIKYGRIQGFTTARFHTTRPQKLLRSLVNIPVNKIAHKRRFFKPDEHVYRVIL